ncbi:Mitochondrial chaperone Frataxin [Mortierella sp. AD094]|nr:Mitochondrial chaperone Frataxin [Mortierella sp. AD094]
MSSSFSLARTFMARAIPTRQTLRQLTTASRSCRKPSSPTVTLSRILCHTRIHAPLGTIAPGSSTVYTSSRAYSSSNSEPQYAISDLSDDDYHTVSDACMDRMVEYFEDLGDEHEIPGYDVEYQSGVMTLKLGGKGTYVVNKQPPNKQLWLSSPTTGPKRYDYDSKHGKWFYSRDHHTLKYLLDTEISEAIGIDIDVPLDGVDNE